jgi:nucleotide-binding universal stress UspA family protein
VLRRKWLPPFKTKITFDPRPPRDAKRGTIKRVLVEYESSAHGREALFHALEVARNADAELTVVAVATRELVGVGCARCRANAVFWNREMRYLAEEALGEAAELLGRSRTVEYAIADGADTRDAVAGAAAGCGADVIVVPSEPNGRFRRLVSSKLAEHLRRDGRWDVVVAPAAAPGTPATAAP